MSRHLIDIFIVLTFVFIQIEARNRRVWFSGGNNFRKCEEPHEERVWCAPMKKCRACGFKVGGPATPQCWIQCRHYECICKKGYSYNPNMECVKNSECKKYLANDTLYT